MESFYRYTMGPIECAQIYQKNSRLRRKKETGGLGPPVGVVRHAQSSMSGAWSETSGVFTTWKSSTCVFWETRT